MSDFIQVISNFFVVILFCLGLASFFGVLVAFGHRSYGLLMSLSL